MPPVDLESLVRGISVCGDAKVACETTLIKPANSNPNKTHWDPDLDSDSDSDSGPGRHPDPDFPAESYCIKIGDEIDWDDINPVYDRDDSTKGTTNPKSNGHHPYTSSNSVTNSKRFSGNLKATTKAPIIALPHKIHRHHLNQSTRRPRAPAFVPKSRGGPGLAEPRSPEVSCFGKVLSQREQRRRPRSPEVSCFGAILRCFWGRRASVEAEEEEVCERRVPASGRRVPPAAAAVGEERPGLGGMRTFVSGRRPASWGGDVAVDLDGGAVDTWRGRVRWIGDDDE